MPKRSPWLQPRARRPKAKPRKARRPAKPEANPLPNRARAPAAAVLGPVAAGFNRSLLQQLGVTDTTVVDIADFVLKAIEATPVLILTYFIARGTRALSRRATERMLWDPQLTLLGGRLVYIGTIILGCVTYIGMVSAPLASVLLGAVGLLGLAFGLAFQDVLKNFLSGVFLMIERPFKIGDEIRIGEFVGKVETILLRVTVLRSADGLRILLPNQQVYTSAIVNNTGYPLRQYTTAVKVPEDAQLDDVLEGATSGLTSIEGIAAEPPPQVGLVPRIEFGTTVEVRYWVDYRKHDPAAIQRQVNALLLKLAGRGAVLSDPTVAGSPVVPPKAAAKKPVARKPPARGTGKR